MTNSIVVITCKAIVKRSINPWIRSSIRKKSGNTGKLPRLNLCIPLSTGMSTEQILEEFDYLTATDIQASLAYAADREHQQMV